MFIEGAACVGFLLTKTGPSCNGGCDEMQHLHVCTQLRQRRPWPVLP